MKKIYVKEFENKQQMYKYFNKAKNNPALDFIFGEYNLIEQKWKITYKYK